MVDIGLLHRADCHATGIAERYAAAVKGAATIYLCAHHAHRHVDALIDAGWQLVPLDTTAKVPA